MRNFRVFTLFLLFTIAATLCFAESKSKTEQKSAATSSTDAVETRSSGVSPEKAADIRKLLELVGTKALVQQSLVGNMEEIKPLLTNSLPPGAYRMKLVDLFYQKFKKKMDIDRFMDQAIVSYDKHLTHEEIKGLIAFYGTPLGQKTVRILPKLSQEMQEAGAKWGQQLGRETMSEVLDENPDLARQMEEAQKAFSGK